VSGIAHACLSPEGFAPLCSTPFVCSNYMPPTYVPLHYPVCLRARGDDGALSYHFPLSPGPMQVALLVYTMHQLDGSGCILL
jgi:hypothetical protein